MLAAAQPGVAIGFAFVEATKLENRIAWRLEASPEALSSRGGDNIQSGINNRGQGIRGAQIAGNAMLSCPRSRRRLGE
jgi:hypothetical protein